MGNADLHFYGGSLIDYIHIEDTTENKNKSFVRNYIPVFNQDTIFLATFEDSQVQGTGLVKESNSDLYSYAIYREDVSNPNVMEYVGTIKNGDLTITDYNIDNHHQYQYLIFSETENYITAPQETDIVNTCWNFWSLVGLKETEDENVYRVDTDNIWQLNLSLETAEQTQNIERVEYKNLTKFPKISQGQSNYITSSISCLLGQINNQGKYMEDVDLLKKWRAFINDTNLKLLKDRKGNKYIIQTMTSNNMTRDYTQEQINVINFTWIELRDSEELSIIESAGEN